MKRWEYLTTILEANTENVDIVYTAGDWATDEAPAHTPEAMMPQLDKLGAKGWELVHMEPVYVGKKNDIMLHEGGGSRRWTSKYFCAFKREI